MVTGIVQGTAAVASLPRWMRYLFAKGCVAINGPTLGEVVPAILDGAD